MLYYYKTEEAQSLWKKVDLRCLLFEINNDKRNNFIFIAALKSWIVAVENVLALRTSYLTRRAFV